MACAALLLSVIAIVIAMYPVITQMIFGKPKIELNFTTQFMDSDDVLQCEIYNRPIRSSTLRKLGVNRRAAEDIVTIFSIKKHHNEDIVFQGSLSKMRSYTGTYAQRISLPASVLPAEFGIAIAHKDSGRVTVFTERPQVILLPGEYDVHIDIIVEGRRISKTKILSVTSGKPFAQWIDN
ncbi:MAG TPA: hypothetical protein G4O12_09100 [Dehalococcoidia bacterium]|nr:hypothetical protein [Dehalococcoidia bacterium]